MHLSRLNGFEPSPVPHARRSACSRRASLRALGAAGLALALGAPCSATQAGGTAPALRLDFIPFTDPLCRLVVLSPDGRLRIVRYYAAGLQTVSAAERTLPAGERRAIGALLAAPDLYRALHAPGAPADGLTRGDQFELGLVSGGEMREHRSGFVDDAAPAVRRLIDALLDSAADAARLEPARLARASVRARPVSAQQAGELPRTGRVRIVDLATLPAPLRATVAATVRDPLLFHPLTPEEQAQLRQRTSPAGGVFVRAGSGQAYQLHIYLSR